jgi:hypothetical protein
MDNLTPDPLDEALRIAGDALVAALFRNETRYPSGTSFVARAHPGFDQLVASYVHESAPFVVVADDGSETLYAPLHAA